MKRRAIVFACLDGGLVLTLAAAASSSRAQRPAQPIARPPRPGGPVGRGRFAPASDGVAHAQPPGLFVVRTINEQDKVVTLGDADGRSADVYVRPEVFDLSELKPGDEIEVDFIVPASNSARLEAASIWKS